MTSYVERLDAAWADHLAPRFANAPTVISTFAGCGGSSLGYSMAGYRELLAVEWDDNAVETFRLNFPDVPVYHGDIAKLSVEDALARAGIGVGDLDVFDGSPPCQGFSTAGKRAIDDPRNGLFREYVRLLRGIQPRAFVMENVSGMVKGKMKLVFAEILRELKACGYRVSARLLDAAYFGVPQNRQRMILIGVREDLGVDPTHPEALRIKIAIREAWQGVGLPEIECWIERYAIGKEWHNLREGQQSNRYMNLIKPDTKKQSPTITKGAGSISLASVVHPIEPRKYSVQEAKRVSSFPDKFVFYGSWGDALERIGNSVPPLFMRAIAEHIRDNILAPSMAQAVAD